jgi:hypothetical protein
MLMQPVPCHAFTGVGGGVHVRMQRHAFVWCFAKEGFKGDCVRFECVSQITTGPH